MLSHAGRKHTSYLMTAVIGILMQAGGLHADEQQATQRAACHGQARGNADVNEHDSHTGLPTEEEPYVGQDWQMAVPFMKRSSMHWPPALQRT